MTTAINSLILPPLSLYVHIPWCVRKCPYCDFNSHEAPQSLPIDDYVKALSEDLHQDSHLAQGRQIESIFFGGGTPSLMPNHAIGAILSMIDSTIGINNNAEITLEANPGTVEHHDFNALRATGVNRISLGVQTFNDRHLSQLGRIHSATNASTAFEAARRGGFDNINIDLMHGLPGQSLAEAKHDLTTAIALAPSHISWYQLTIEKNTEFYSSPPLLPQEDTLVDIQEMGQALLHAHQYRQYEISAYALSPSNSARDRQSAHNLNYWQFGDYLGIGAGAHGKITQANSNTIVRTQKTRLPKDYLSPDKDFSIAKRTVSQDNLPLEFMMNALRLNNGVSTTLFAQRTGLPTGNIRSKIDRLIAQDLLEDSTEVIAPTPLGQRFLNNLLAEFMND